METGEKWSLKKIKNYLKARLTCNVGQIHWKRCFFVIFLKIDDIPYILNFLQCMCVYTHICL